MSKHNTRSDKPPHGESHVDLPVERPRQSRFSLERIDVPAALAVLDSFLKEDEGEQRDTFEFLKNALNETRAARGERLLFPDE